VTGGSKGIGRAVAEGLAAEGARVAIVARARETLEAAAWEIGARAAAEVHAIAADLSVLDGVARAIAEARRRLGRIDILVNNAGSIRAGDFLATADEQWTADWNLKLLGYIRMSRAVFPFMQAQGGGASSTSSAPPPATRARPTSPAAAANAALVNFTKGLADLGARSNILVTACRRPPRGPSAGFDARQSGGGDGEDGGRGGRRVGGRLPARADRPADGRRRPRVLPCLRAGQLSDRDLHHDRRGLDPRRLPVMTPARVIRVVKSGTFMQNVLDTIDHCQYSGLTENRDVALAAA